jgi:hypothetical protein
MKCTHCGDELGEGDAYDLMKSHLWNCNSKAAKKVTDAIEEETNGAVWEYDG